MIDWFESPYRVHHLAESSLRGAGRQGGPAKMSPAKKPRSIGNERRRVDTEGCEAINQLEQKVPTP
jgi:hypothetical protein